MECIIDTSTTKGLNWSAKGKERIAQNVLNIIKTWQFEVAYNRNMGIATKLLDKPVDIASSLYISEIYKVVAEYESRATVKQVKFTGLDDEGNMQFKVVINI